MIRKMTAIAIIGFIALAFQHVNAQTYQSSAAKVTIKGTSTLHDWDMTSPQGIVKATFVVSNNQVTAVNALSFQVLAESLKSSKSGLDKNAYKALNTGTHKQITFTMTSGQVTPASGGNFKVSVTGNLTIAGTTKSTTIHATGVYNPGDQSISVNGTTKFNMTAYKVTPPTVMMGTIKTGDPITIDYSVKLIP